MQRAVLIMMSGLPGTGKSYVSHKLGRTLGARIVESDRVRKELFPHPGYSALESAITHGACRELLRGALSRGACAIYDATNLVEFHRQAMYALARVCGAALIIVRTVASAEDIFHRLALRRLRPDGNSDADWAVYLRMLSAEEPIQLPHFSLNTSESVEGPLLHLLEVIRDSQRV